MSELLARRHFTVEEYHRMGEAGIPPEDNPAPTSRGARGCCGARAA